MYSYSHNIHSNNASELGLSLSNTSIQSSYHTFQVPVQPLPTYPPQGTGVPVIPYVSQVGDGSAISWIPPTYPSSASSSTMQQAPQSIPASLPMSTMLPRRAGGSRILKGSTITYRNEIQGTQRVQTRPVILGGSSQQTNRGPASTLRNAGPMSHLQVQNSNGYAGTQAQSGSNYRRVANRQMPGFPVQANGQYFVPQGPTQMYLPGQYISSAPMAPPPSPPAERMGPPRTTVPTRYTLREGKVVFFTSRNKPGLLISEFTTDPSLLDGGSDLVALLSKYIRIRWTFQWPGYKTDVYDLDLSPGFTLTHLAWNIYLMLNSVTQKGTQSAMSNSPQSKRWAIGPIGIQESQIYLMSFGYIGNGMWAPEFEVEGVDQVRKIPSDL